MERGQRWHLGLIVSQEAPAAQKEFLHVLSWKGIELIRGCPRKLS